MKNKTLLLCLLTLTILTLHVSAEKFTKIHPDVIQQLSLKNSSKLADIYIEFKNHFNQVTPSTASSSSSAAAAVMLNKMDEKKRGRFVLSSLLKIAEKSQKNVVKFMKKQYPKLSVPWVMKSFYIDNSIHVKSAPKEFIEKVATLFPEVRMVSLDTKIDPSKFIEKPKDDFDHDDDDDRKKTVEWNVEWVKAPAVWKMGFKGKGIVIANSDTGVLHTHPALSKSYRGSNGNHDYNWYDPSLYEPSRSPVDTQGHGTHCMGTKVGVDGGNEIGIATESKWIACRSLGPGASRTTVLSCLQFFLAPHDVDGENPNPDKRPHITSHSYLCNGCRLEDAVQALRDAGVMVIVAAGNSGPRCQSVTDPASYKPSFAVGALDVKSDKVVYFSSRGPNGILLKPEIMAPGTDVRSSYGEKSYRLLSGTSMASPAVAGCVALLWEAVPELKRNIEETEKILKESALGQESDQCDPTGQSPNNVFGYGTINIEAAVKLAQQRFNKK